MDLRMWVCVCNHISAAFFLMRYWYMCMCVCTVMAESVRLSAHGL